MTKIKPIVYIVIGVILLVALFLGIKSKSKTISPVIITSPAVSTQPNTKSFELEIKNKMLVAGSETLKVTEGDNVVIKITSDEDEEFHLHGYDKIVDLQKGQPAQLSFLANLTGRFVYELEKSQTDIGAIEVSPK